MGRTAFLTAVLALLTALSWVWFAPTPFGGSVTYTVVSGSSMSPLLAPGYLVLLRRTDGLSVGDVAGYHSSTGRAVLHRVVAVTEEGYVFQGDANYWRDTDRPRDEDILGRLWVSVPVLGRGVDWLRQPLRIAALAGVMAAMTANQLRPPGSRAWPRRMFHRPHDTRTSMLELAAAGSLGRVMAGSMGAIAFAAMALGTYAFLTPAFYLRQVPVPYEHSGRFSYSAVSVVPAALPPGTVGEALSDRLGDPRLRRLIEVPVTTGQPLLLNVNPNFDVTFRYELTRGAIRNPHGTVSLDATIRDITGWERRYAISPMSEFHGDHVEITVSQLSLRSFLESVSLYQAVTGHAPRYYTATMNAQVRVQGLVGDEPFAQVFTPQFVMRIVPPLEVYPETEDTRALDLPGSDAQGPADPFVRTQRGEVTTSSYQRAALPFLRWQLDMYFLRTASLAVLGISLSVIAGILLLARRAHARGEAFVIRAQYGSSLVLVDAAAEGHDPTLFIGLSTMDDLARVALHNGGPILVELRDGRQTYLVREGEHFYSYVGDPERNGGPH